MTDSNKKDNYEELHEEILAEAKSDSQHAQSESDDKGSDLPSDFHSEDEGAMEGKTVRVPADVSSNEYLSKNQSENRLQKSFDSRQTNGYARPRKKRRTKANYSAYMGIILATLVICVSVVLSLFIIVIGRDVLGIESQSSSFTIKIPEGSTSSDIADQLYNEGVIYYKNVLLAIARFKGAEGNTYPGDLDVADNMSYADIIDSLMVMRDAKETVTVTFPEGITLLDAAQILEQSGVCDADDFIYTFNSSVFGFEFEKYVSSSSLKLYKNEGYLFPDTYEFYVGDSAYNVVKKIKTRTDEILNSEAIDRAAEIGMNIDEVVVLASIVQREASNVDDMRNIASVFLNRLADPEGFPNLQSDTTYSYIENVIKNVLSVEYQEMYDAYDSYTCVGLPVGAICNPGLDAINAVLYPNDTDYYYFCSDLSTGETYYAMTYDEHLDNCERAGLV